MKQSSDLSFEQSLRQQFTSIRPEASFVEQLEGKLLSEASGMQSLVERPERKKSYRWVAAFAILTIAILGSIAFVGPEKVWAAVRGLLGYVPGFGIVPVSSDAYVLPEPIEVKKGEVTLRAEQLLATADKTYLAYTVQGLPREEKLHLAQVETSPGEALFGTNSSTSMECPIENCSDGSQAWRYRVIREFSSLPKGTTQVTLIWKRYASNQIDVLQEWRVPLYLKPLTDDLRARLYPPAYELSNKQATQHDVTLQVSEVTQDLSTTVVKTRLLWPEGFSMIDYVPEQLSIIDDAGQTYHQQDTSVLFSDNGQSIQAVTPAMPGETPLSGYNRTLVFQPINQVSSQVTFQAKELYWQAYFYALIHVNLGTNPQIGDEWPLDETVDIAGTPLHLSGMRLVEFDWPTGEKLAELQFKVDPFPEESGMRVDILHFEGGDDKGIGYHAGKGSTDGYISGVVLTPEQRQSGQLTISGQDAMGILRGPWEISWKTPN